ncbi:MAG: hypothetical protein HUJ28_10815 [Chromatiales bacterium]|nr:hypothetical protein [Chromatiales bacterium]
MPRSPKPEITLLVPGLFERLSEWQRDYQYTLQTPSLELLARRGEHDHLGSASFEETACRLFGLERNSDRDLPIAALTYPLDHDGRSPEGFCLRADPVYLEAGIRELVLQPPEQLALTAEEAASLVETLNGHFAEDGLRFEAATPDRWYLHLPVRELLATFPLSHAVGKDVHPLLPRGKRTAYWHGMLNELQMLLHQSGVNRAREARGARPVNSVWLWGAGEPPGRWRADWTHVWSDDFIVRGLALATGAADRPSPAGADAWLAELKGDRHLLVIEPLFAPAAMDDFEAWQGALAQLESDWFAPLLKALRRGRIRRLAVVGSEGCRLAADRRQLGRFWRRRRDLVDLCRTAA